MMATAGRRQLPGRAESFFARVSDLSAHERDLASGPVHTNAMTDQKIRSLSCNPGRIVSVVIGVAEPNRHQAIAPRATSSSVALQRAMAPALFNHFPISKP